MYLPHESIIVHIISILFRENQKFDCENSYDLRRDTFTPKNSTNTAGKYFPISNEYEVWRKTILNSEKMKRNSGSFLLVKMLLLLNILCLLRMLELQITIVIE